MKMERMTALERSVLGLIEVVEAMAVRSGCADLLGQVDVARWGLDEPRSNGCSHLCDLGQIGGDEQGGDGGGDDEPDGAVADDDAADVGDECAALGHRERASG